MGVNLRVVIYGNCQVSSWAEVLPVLNASISVLEYALVTHESSSTYLNSLKMKNPDAILVMTSLEQQLNISKEIKKLTTAPIIFIPDVTCNVFHPDISYVFNKRKVLQNVLGGDWNSRIMAEGFRIGLTVDSISQALNDEILYEKAGYFEYWNDFIENSTVNFELCEIDFFGWLSKVRQYGNFMHGINHPKLIAVGALAEPVVEKLGLKSQDFSVVDELCSDPLSDSVWPVSPLIAEFFGLKQSNLVRFNGEVMDFENFIMTTLNLWRLDTTIKNEYTVWPEIIEFSEIMKGANYVK